MTHRRGLLIERILFRSRKENIIRNQNFEQMLMNWPERVWIYSPVREIFQRREVRKWLKFAAPRNQGLALEIGCGLGRGARLMADRMGFSDVIAFDIEETLVRRSIFLTPKRLKNTIDFYVGDAQDLPFEDSTFDAVVNFGIIHHVLDWRRCISEIARTLKKGGTFYFEEIYPPLYANLLLKAMLRHPREDRFDEPQFLSELSRNSLELVHGFMTGSKFGIVAAARKV